MRGRSPVAAADTPPGEGVGVGVTVGVGVWSGMGLGAGVGVGVGVGVRVAPTCARAIARGAADGRVCGLR